MTESGEFAMFIALGLTSIGLLFGPIGSAVARRIAGRPTDLEQRLGDGGPDSVVAEVDELHARVAALESGQHRLADVEERLDFTERLLARQHEADRLGGGAE